MIYLTCCLKESKERKIKGNSQVFSWTNQADIAITVIGTTVEEAIGDELSFRCGQFEVYIEY